ncbi:MAG TPA: hypothetical protein ENK49_00060 [Gammaproteobacteria bacterium]|nr:hypothetical protein [Gammaproteobacteria bacterium]
MIASNPTPKLARGLNKRLVRELSTAVKSRVDEAIRKTMQRNREQKSRKGWYRQVVSELCGFVGDSYVGTAALPTRPKHPACLVLYLDSCEVEGRLQLVCFQIDSKTFTVEPKVVGLYVARHALERVFQRLGLSRSEEAMQEIIPAIEELLLNPVLGEIRIKSRHGLFLGNSEKNEAGNITAVITTFVDDSRLRPDQL